MLKIVFMGTPDFAEESLHAIYEKGHKILAVITKEDKPQGRGMKLVQTPVKQFAISKNIPVYQPTRLKNNQEIIDIIKNLNPDIICVVAYGKILPKEILEIPKLGCVNVHGSLLPKYRGAAPIQWAVINGDKTTGITTIYMDEHMDTGDMILKREVEIDKDETVGELWDRLSKIGGEVLVETLEKIENGTAPRITQKGDSSIAPMLSKEISKIDWENKTALEIKNLTRGLNPIMGTFSYLDDKKIKFWKTDVISLENFVNENDVDSENVEKAVPGEVLLADSKKGLFIQTKKGILKILEIQNENSKRMSIYDFLRGNSIQIGKVFK